MAALLVLMMTASALVLTATYIARLRASNRLTAGRFSVAVTVGWGTALLVFYFMGLAVASEIQLTSELILLGLGIVILNLMIAFPVSFLLYKYVLSKLFPKIETSRE